MTHWITLAVLAALAIGAANASDMRERKHMRNQRYGEIIIVTGGPFWFTGHVYNTVGLNDCPEAQWKALDPAQLKKQWKARAVILNGPRYFMMDSNALANPGGVATFGGLQARLLATLPISLFNVLRGKAEPYVDNKVNRTTRYVYKAGRPVYELVSPAGVVYVMQTYSRIVNPKLSESDLPGLASQLKMPPGWKYQARVPSTDLVMSTTGVAYVLQDNLENSYQRMN